MRRMSALVLALWALPALADDRAFELDGAHSYVGFKAATVLFDVPGRFDKFSVDVKGHPDHVETAKIKVEIDAASVNTMNPKRDDHLRTPDFFDVQKFPKIVFTSTKVAREGNKVNVTGTLEMHGKTQEITVPFEEVVAVNGAGHKEWVYKASLPIKNSVFGIGAESVAAKISLKDDVQLDLVLAGFFTDAPAPQAAPVPAKGTPPKPAPKKK
ncbi:MAG: YceI family protein [Myxococcota bacterium]